MSKTSKCSECGNKKWRRKDKDNFICVKCKQIPPDTPLAAEKVKTKFNWNDREDKDLLIPCEHCKALDEWACCDDGSHSSACNYCDYNIILHCLKKER